MSSSLLKEYKPNFVLVDFDIIINCKSLDIDYFAPFLEKNLEKYVRNLWKEYEMILLVNDLKQEAFEQRMQSSLFNTPLIEEEDSNEINDEAIIKSVINCIQWQIIKNQETKSNRLIQKLILKEALSRKKIQIDIYDDIILTFTKWRLVENIKVYVSSEIQTNLLDLLLAVTSKGNLNEHVDGLFGGNFGTKDMSETYTKIAKSQSSDPNNFLYLTNFGRGAKAANKAGMNVIIIQRPEDVIREYYTIKYPTIQSIEDIQFVQKLEKKVNGNETQS